MSEKKAKLERKQNVVEREKQSLVVNVITISQLANGNVTVNGPIGDSMLFRDIMNKGERAALEYQRQAVKKDASRIVLPSMRMGVPH